jgi:hypothetical protein
MLAWQLDSPGKSLKRKRKSRERKKKLRKSLANPFLESFHNIVIDLYPRGSDFIGPSIA